MLKHNPRIVGNFSVFATYTLLSGLYRPQVAAAVDLRLFFTRTQVSLIMSIVSVMHLSNSMLKTRGLLIMLIMSIVGQLFGSHLNPTWTSLDHEVSCLLCGHIS